MGQKICILGGGISGVYAAILASQNQWDVFVSDHGLIDDNYKELLQQHQIRFEEQNHSRDLILNSDLIVRSPGIPATANILNEIKEKQIPIVSEIEFSSRYYKGKIIAITGSNGKTTTTSLCYKMLLAANYNVAVGGNIGVPFAQLLLNDHPEWVVLELSSFQLEDIHGFQADIAAVLNITADHLTNYDYDILAYAKAKWNLTKNLGEDAHFLTNGNDPLSNQLLVNVPVSSKVYSLFNEDIDRVYEAISLDRSKIKLKGRHNDLNICFAAAMAKLAGVQNQYVNEAIYAFEPMEHRLEDCGIVNGVQYINDSKATNIDATKYALDAFKNIIWIVGGTDKGNDYYEIKDLINSNVIQIVVLAKDVQPFVQKLSGFTPPISTSKSMNEAVRIAEQLSSDGHTILLSPACASFDLFDDYKDRGDQFKAAIHLIKNKL